MGVIVFRQREDDVLHGIEAAAAAESGRRAVAYGIVEAYCDFNRAMEVPCPVSELDGFADAVRRSAPEGTGMFCELLAPDCPESARGALGYLCSMLEHILRSNPDVQDEPEDIVSALCSRCVFDGRSHALFATECDYHVLDKDAGRIDTFSARHGWQGSVSPWDIVCEKRSLNRDPVFERFLTNRYESLRHQWLKAVGDSRKASRDVRRERYRGSIRL